MNIEVSREDYKEIRQWEIEQERETLLWQMKADQDFRKWEAEHQRHQQWINHSSMKTIENGQSAVRGCFLINGGAILGLLTFMGNAKNQNYFTEMLMFSFGLFITGLVNAVSASGVSYFAQSHYTHTKNSSGDGWTYLAVILVFSSILAFVIGSAFAAYAILT